MNSVQEKPVQEKPVQDKFRSSAKSLIELIINGVLLAFLLGIVFPTLLRYAAGNSAISASDLAALRQSIVGQESAGNFRAVNPDSGALGYGQVMPDNLASWSQEALGYSLTSEEFLARPDLQIAILNHKLDQYWREAIAQSGGDEELAVRMVASRWYSGRADWYNSTTPQYYDGTEYPSIQEYTLSVLEKYRQQ